MLLGAFIPLVTLAVIGDDGARSLFDGRYVVDDFSLILKALFLLAAYVVVLMSQTELEEGGYYQGEFYVLLLCSVLGMVMMTSSRDLVSIFIALELLSIPAYMLAAWRKRDPKSNEAGVKYYLLGVFASAVLLYGMSLLYGATGSTLLTDIGAAVADGDLIGLEVVAVAFVIAGFALQGVGGAVPHVGARHVRGRADAGHRVPVGGVEGGRVRRPDPRHLHRLPRGRRRVRPADLGARRADDDGRQRARPAPDEHRAHARLLERQPGRLHPHAAGVRRQPRRRASRRCKAVVVYLLIYGFTNLGAFAVVIAVSRKTRSGEISSFGGLITYAPGLAVLMTIFLASLAGIPPLGGWIAKFNAFKAVLDAGTDAAYALAVIGAVNTAIAAAYYLRVMREMWMNDVPDGDHTPDRHAAAGGGRARHHRPPARSCSACCPAS